MSNLLFFGLFQIYGKTLLQQTKFQELVICDGADASRLVSDPRFRDAAPILCPEDEAYGRRQPLRDEERDRGTGEPSDAADPARAMYGVSMDKRSVAVDAPVHLGAHILWQSKLLNMRFVEVLKKYLDPRKFAVAYADTDSLFLILHHPELSDNVLPCKRAEWFRDVYHQWFVPDSCPGEHRDEWTRRMIAGDPAPAAAPDCCRRCHVKHTRTPGLLKEEFHASKFVALNAKSYCLVGANGTDTKRSMKGVNESLAGHLDYDAFVRCLERGEPEYVVNRGFVTINGHVLTYAQVKRALTNLLVKRVVDERDPAISYLITLTRDVEPEPEDPEERDEEEEEEEREDPDLSYLISLCPQ